MIHQAMRVTACVFYDGQTLVRSDTMCKNIDHLYGPDLKSFIKTLLPVWPCGSLLVAVVARLTLERHIKLLMARVTQRD